MWCTSLSPLPESSVLEVVLVCVHPCASERMHSSNTCVMETRVHTSNTCVMETGRFKRVAEMLEPQLNMLVAQVYVCLYVYTYVCMYVCMYIYIFSRLRRLRRLIA